MINDVKRVKDFNIQYVSGIWGDHSSEENDDGIFVLRSTEQKLNGELNIINPAYIKADYKSKNILREGDLLITKSSGSKSHVGKCSYISKEVASCKYAFSNFMIGIRVKDRKLTPEYLYFCINSKLIKRQIERNSMNVTLNNLNQNNISNWFIPFFSIDIQKNIVNFLKNEIKIIDKKLKKYNKKIELLKEYKEALIYETVTKGLDKNVEMKDSGVDWIGKIPNTWNIKRFKNYYTNFGGGNYGEEPQKSSKIILPCFSISDFKNGNLNNNNKILIKTLRAYDKKNILKKGILLIEKSGGGEKNPVGRIVMVEEDIEGYYTNFVQGIKINKKINEKYILFLLNSIYKLRLHMRYVKQNTGLQNFNFNSFANNLFIPLLSLREQNEIVDFLDKKTEEIDNEVKKLSKKVKLIEELKESIIYECVTGKLNIEVEGEKYQKIIESI